MGVDLTLLPYDHDSHNFAFSHTVLQCDRDREFWDVIADVEKRRGRMVIDDFTSYVARGDASCQEPHYGKTTTTPYGDALMEVEVADLLPVGDRIDPTHRKTLAVWAYLRQLPERTKVALFWH